MILSVQLMLSPAHMALSFVAPPSSPEYETSALGRSLNLIERLHSWEQIRICSSAVETWRVVVVSSVAIHLAIYQKRDNDKFVG